MTELQPPDNGDTGVLVVGSTDNVGTKRQRRPSVRLGDIGGDQSHDSHRRSKIPYNSNSYSKNRALEGEGNLDCVAIGSWKVRDSKSKSKTKRVRSNWVSKLDDCYDGFRDFGDSDSPVKGNSGVNSLDGVRVWLNQLGLGRYVPVFEIHEVDDEALPMLTLDDLKDMGIHAVGSRRKMYSSIQKLGNKTFSSPPMV